MIDEIPFPAYNPIIKNKGGSRYPHRSRGRFGRRIAGEMDDADSDAAGQTELNKNRIGTGMHRHNLRF